MRVFALPLVDELVTRATDDCIPWPGRPKSNGYGQIQVDGRKHGAHRFVFERAHGPLLPGEKVRHSCDVRICVNPRHLLRGSQAQNMQDAVERGRHTNAAKTHCKHGHEFTEDNTYRAASGGRACRACRAERMSKWQRANKDKVNRNQQRYRQRLREKL